MIATGSLRATWLPEGNGFIFVCTYNLKISYETILLHSCVLVCFSDSFCIFVLSLKIAGVEGRTFVVVNRSFPMVWILLWKTLPKRPTETASCAEGRCSRYSGAIFAQKYCWELTHTFCLFFLLPILFDRRSHLRSSSNINSSSFLSVKCW